MNTNIILINDQDQPIGEDTVINCHLGDAIRHRAITAFLRNEKGQYLMAKRSLQKPLWPTYWDAAFSTHPRVGETVEACCVRRVQEELGINLSSKNPQESAINLSSLTGSVARRIEEPQHFFTDHFSYEYHFRWNVVFSEWEMNHILIAQISSTSDLTHANPEEVSELKWLSWPDITYWSNKDTDLIAPWLTIAIDKIQNTPKLLTIFRS